MNTNNRVKTAVRVDGGPDIGMGHVQRCLALGSQLKKNGAEILFMSKRNETVEKKIKQEGFEVVALRYDIDLKENLKDTINAIKASRPDVVITDSYVIDEYYLTGVKKRVPLLVSIDDLAEVAFPSDIVINQNIYAEDLTYRSLSGKTKFFLGPKYALLREDFSNLGKRKISEKVKNILITLGGTDSFNLTPKILKILDRVNQDFKITVAIGPFFRNIAEIEKTAREIDKKVELSYDSHRMSKIMLASDLAITGGGTTLYELATTGTPALAFCLADNQGENIKAMSEYGTVVNLGHEDKLMEEKSYKKIDSLIENSTLRETMSKLGQKSVNGKGSQRVSKAIMENFLRTISKK